MLDLEQQKQEFLSLCHEYIHRDGLEDLLVWLQKADFFTAPASTRFHGAYAGGLCEHSIDVFRMAQKGIKGYELDLNMESVAIATLFHDLCKVNFYKTDKRNQKVNGEWTEVTFYTVEEKFVFGGHGSKSVFLVQQFMRLKTDEATAINCHMGATPGGDAGVSPELPERRRSPCCLRASFLCAIFCAGTAAFSDCARSDRSWAFWEELA